MAAATIPDGHRRWTGVPTSLVHAVLVHYRLYRLRHVDIRTGGPVCPWEGPRPGSMMHVDVKKLKNTPDGGGWRFVGRVQGGKNRFARMGGPAASDAPRS